MSTSCPSRLKLERYELEGVDLTVAHHVRGCASCQQRLASMRREAADFSGQPRSQAARQAFVGADRRWRAIATALVAVPAALVALFFAAPLLVRAPEKVAGTPSNVRRQARELVEVRASPRGSTLKRISVGGRPVDFGQGSLQGYDALAGESRPFVLTHTDVKVDVLGFVSTVEVTQTFTNPFETPVEAVYAFPLPEDAAVDDLTLTAGGRVIKSSIQKRAEARRRYEEAKSQGHRAALLDQERPNIFTQSVANLLPHESVKVTIHYVTPLRFDDGEYTLNFPMVVGPRFMPGEALAGAAQGTGTERDTTAVPDASRISPPAERTGRDVSITVNLDAAFPIEGVWSDSHRLHSERLSASRQVITLDEGDTIPNRDLVLSWAVSGAEKRATLLATGGTGSTFALLLAPEVKARQAVLTKEMVFVIDTSCSMTGPPLDAAKAAMSLALEQMNPDDTFLLIDFADRASSFSPSPLPNTPENVQRALSYLRQLPAAGGTNQVAGIEAALHRPADPRRLREVLLMTDGYIGNDDEVFAAATRDLGEARLFGVGIGTSVNHHLLRRLSEEGRGFYQYLDPQGDPRPAIARFVRRISRPLLTNVELDWGTLEVFDVLPRRIPDLFDDQPLLLLGRAKRPGRALVTVRGLVGAQPYEQRIAVELPEQDTGAQGLSAMWARAKIETLDRDVHSSENVAQLTTLGLEYHLVTAYTSLVATEALPVTGQPGQTVVVPTEFVAETGTERPLEQKRFNTIQILHGSAAPQVKSGQYGYGYSGAQSPENLYRVDGVAASDPASPTIAPSPRPGSSEGDDFETAFGGTPRHAAHGDNNKTYVPASVTPDDFLLGPLTTADIMEAVVSQRKALAACAEEQHRRQPGLSGKLVLQWTVDRRGKVVGVTVVSEEFKATYVAACMSRVISQLHFPANRYTAGPVMFPFKF